MSTLVSTCTGEKDTDRVLLLPKPAPIQTNLYVKTRAYWELARFHTRESWLSCFPAVWGLCVSAGRNEVSVTLPQLIYLIIANWISMTLIHGSFCALNDIIDVETDVRVERTKSRPIASGRITRSEAVAFFFLLCGGASIFTYYSLGPLAFWVVLPSYPIATIYPYMKRIVSWPQLILAPAVGWPVFAGWVSGEFASNFPTIVDCIPLFVFYCVWTIYFDTCYALQDARDDRKIGNGSLAVALGSKVKLFLGVLGILLISLLCVTAERCNFSLIYWLFGVAVWAVSIPLQLWYLDLDEPKTGGTLFRMNISLGLYITVVSCVELAWKNLVFV